MSDDRNLEDFRHALIEGLDGIAQAVFLVEAQLKDQNQLLEKTNEHLEKLALYAERRYKDPL